MQLRKVRPLRAKARVALALGATVALALSACGGSTPGDTKTAAKDRITVGVPTLPIGLDPITYNDSATQMVYKLVNESLYRYTGPNEISPLLADGMPEISADKKTYTIRLKKGVTFTNGDAFDAEDVAFTFQTILNPTNGSYHRSSLTVIKAVSAVDPQTVKVELNHPYSPFMYQLTRVSMVTSTVAYKASDTYATTLIGTGPYKVAKLVRGQEIVLEANDTFREKGIPNIPQVVVKAFPDANSRLTALKTDQVQVLPQVSPAAVSTVEKFANIYRSDSDLVASRFWFWPNQKGGMMTDQRVRKAITIAIDRGRVVETSLRGYGYPISTLPSAREGAVFFNPDAQAWGKEPQIEEAKKLVAEAGVAGKKLHIVVPTTNATVAAVVDSVQQQLEAIGFKIEREDLAQAAALDRLFNGNYDLYANANTASTGESGLDATFGLYRIGAAINLNGVADKELDQLATEAVQTNDLDNVLERMRKRQLAYIPDMPIAIGLDLTGLSKNLDGFKINAFGDYYELAYVK